MVLSAQRYLSLHDGLADPYSKDCLEANERRLQQLVVDGDHTEDALATFSHLLVLAELECASEHETAPHPLCGQVRPLLHRFLSSHAARLDSASPPPVHRGKSCESDC